MLAQIAWRNLWRNPRRTSLTLLAISGSLAGLFAFNGVMAAISDRIVEGFTGSFLGQVQVHREDWREERQIGMTIPEVDTVLGAVRSTKGVEGAAARIYGFAHASLVRGESSDIRGGGGDDVASPVVLLLGVDPEHEPHVTDLAEKIVDGRWLQGGAEVIVGSGVAERHNVHVGDAFLPTSIDQGGALRGPWAVSDEVPRIVGVIRTGIETVDRRMALMPLDYVAQLTGTVGQAHEVAIRTDPQADLELLVGDLRTRVGRARNEVPEDVSIEATSALSLVREGEPEPEIAPDAAVPAPPPAPTIRLVGLELQEQESGSEVEEEDGFVAGGLPRRAEEVALSESAARELGMSVGDRLTVAIPVDCGDDVSAAECPPSEEPFVVAGVFRAPENVLGGRLALVSRAVLVGNIGGLAPDVVTTLEGEEAARIGGLVQHLRPRGESVDEIMAWYDIAPEMKQFQAMMQAMPAIISILIFIAVALGVINTMLMATYERTREIGLMMALGMHPRRVIGLVLTESILLALVGCAIGSAVGLAIVGWWAANGLDMSGVTGGQPMSMNGVQVDSVMWPRIVVVDAVTSVVIVSVMTVLAGLWPAFRASRLVPTEALRQD